MFTLRFNQSISGNNFAHQRGDEVDWYDEADALSLIHAGIAKPVCDAGKKAYESYRAEQVKQEAQGKAKAKAKTPPPEPAKPETPEPDPVPVSVLDLDETTIGALVAAGLETVAAIQSHPDLTKIEGIGKATAKKILQACASV